MNEGIFMAYVVKERYHDAPGQGETERTHTVVVGLVVGFVLVGCWVVLVEAGAAVLDGLMPVILRYPKRESPPHQSSGYPGQGFEHCLADTVSAELGTVLEHQQLFCQSTAKAYRSLAVEHVL